MLSEEKNRPNLFVQVFFWLGVIGTIITIFGFLTDKFSIPQLIATPLITPTVAAFAAQSSNTPEPTLWPTSIPVATSVPELTPILTATSAPQIDPTATDFVVLSSSTPEPTLWVSPVPTAISMLRTMFDTNLAGWVLQGDGGHWNMTASGLTGFAPFGTDSFYVANNVEHDFLYEATFVMTGGGDTASAGIIFRSRSNPQNGSYMARISTYRGGEISLVRFYPTRNYQSLGVQNLTIAKNVQYTIRVEATGSNITVALNGNTVIQAYDNSYSSGATGLVVNNSTTEFTYAVVSN